MDMKNDKDKRVSTQRISPAMEQKIKEGKVRLTMTPEHHEKMLINFIHFCMANPNAKIDRELGGFVNLTDPLRSKELAPRGQIHLTEDQVRPFREGLNLMINSLAKTYHDESTDPSLRLEIYKTFNPPSDEEPEVPPSMIN